MHSQCLAIEGLSWIIAIKANQENNLGQKGIIFEDIKMAVICGICYYLEYNSIIMIGAIAMVEYNNNNNGMQV